MSNLCKIAVLTNEFYNDILNTYLLMSIKFTKEANI